ncbi:putative bifunctional diguanylate cyclase/phosphodiesterase [Sphingomonas quercus]|uniref:EAL domain-containing protein n=1 Tax=Sphingomonas quercus TaxID=2842451 RepID=A0ABS6BGH8_9SPHN|nr:EAL domain-containing protein [Sphingomonas quercus]MBU3077398.1 EAL domain-containing protein [Sphingomonas quercus]
MPQSLGPAGEALAETELRAQHANLQQQIPLMYALIAIDVAFLTIATWHDVPSRMSIAAPGILVSVAMIRGIIWASRRDKALSEEQIRRQLRGTMIAAALLSLMFGAWGVWLMSHVDAAHGSSVALYVFVGAISCCYCLQALPAAARLVLTLGAAPVTLRMLFADDWYIIGIGISFILVAGLILRTLSATQTAFRGLLRSRSELRAVVAALQDSEENHRYSVELNPQIPWISDPHGAIIELSPRWSAYTGIPLADALGSGWTSAVHPEDLPDLLQAWKDALAERQGAIADVRYRLRQRDASYRWFRARANPRRDPAGHILKWYGNLEDIHDQVEAELALRESEELYRLASRATNDIIWDWSPVTGRIQWAGEVDNIFGYTEIAEGTSLDWWMEQVHPDDRADMLSIHDRVMRNLQDSWSHEHRFRAGDGSFIQIFARGYAIRDAEGRAIRAIGAMSDITLAKRVEEDLRWAAFHDALTTLPNRKFFADELERALVTASADLSLVGVVIVDVDGFKSINDGLGHAAGDTVLITVAGRLQANIPTGATVARLGGDEFAVILPGLTEGDKRVETLKAILAGVGDAVIIEEGAVDVNLCAGAAMWPIDGATAEEVVKSADLALYAAKAEGPGTMRGFRPEMRERIEGRNQMLRDARQAVQDERVVPFYQPKIALASGEIVGFEALLRWHHPGNGLQGPDMIAGAFEDSSLATQLTDRMLEGVLTDLNRWLDQGFRIGRVALNGSTADFRRDDFADRILRRFHKAGLPPSLLELEVTETVLLGQFADSVERAFNLLRAEGAAIALDDFGTGYASLTHLRQFPVDVLKIDRSFISRLTDVDGADFAIVHGMIDIARRMAIQTVAEGVEEQIQAAKLRELGCDVAQGFLYSPAIAADRVPLFLRNWEQDREPVGAGRVVR